MWTVALLAIGFIGMIYVVGMLQSVPSAFAVMHESAKLAPYTPPAQASTIITIGSIAVGGLWAVSAGFSVWLLTQKRLAFYVPLIAGFLAIVVLFVVIAVFVGYDPTLTNYYSGLSAR